MPRSSSTSYLGNPKIKAEGVKQSYTMDQVHQYQQCAQDPIFFIRNYVKIVHVDRGEILFPMWPFQEEMVLKFVQNRFCIVKCPRQVGKSITTVSFLLWTILFKDHQNIAILANKYKTAQKLLDDLKKSYMALPKWMQQGVIEWNKGNIELENGCKIMAAATAGDAIRGNSFNLIFLDEFAFVPPNIADEFFDSVYPTISSGDTTKIIIVSTPKGMNKFHKMWVEANYAHDAKDETMQWNGYVPFEINWRMVPGRTEAWRKDTIARTSEQQFRQEFECEFIGSSNTLISPEKLKNMTWRAPVRRLENRYSQFDEGVKHYIDIFTEPEPRHQYVLSADVAGGKELDSSAFVVLDVTKMPYLMVAKYKSDKISQMLFPDVIYQAACMYNMAFVMVETNDNDVAKTLQMDLEYENLITTVNKGKGTQVGGGFTKNVEFGLRSNKQTKRIGCQNLKTLIEGDKIIVEDHHIYIEFNQFISNARASYSAVEGAHDDLVMCLVNFAWLVNQKYFKDLTDSDVYSMLKKDYDDAIDEEAGFFGFISNGTDFADDDGLRL